MRRNILLFPLTILCSAIIAALATGLITFVTGNRLLAIGIGLIVAICAFFLIAILIQKMLSQRKR
jgi:CBS-domain-containing membrane protein